MPLKYVALKQGWRKCSCISTTCFLNAKILPNSSLKSEIISTTFFRSFDEVKLIPLKEAKYLK